MKKKVKGKLGTYSNHGLQAGFGNIQSNEEELNHFREIITNEKRKISNDYTNTIKRLDVFIKEYIGAYPDENTFANYFFAKRKINQWGDNTPKVTDETILNVAIEYVENLKNKLNLNQKEQKNPNSKVYTSFKWLKSEQSLNKLFEKLITENFIHSKTKYKDFKDVFSEIDVSNIENKIVWLKKGKNKKLNKKSISDLILILFEEKFIEKKDSLPKILSYCFKYKDEKGEYKDTKFTHSNLSNKETLNFSTYRSELENIINKL